MKRARGGGAARGALDAGGSGSGGGACDAAAEGAGQALLLATQALGVNAAAVRDARDGLGVLFDMLLDYANSCGKVFTADDILLLGVRSNEVVRLALERGADLNAIKSWSEWTPLLSAAAGGHADSAKLLLEAGADKDRADNQGYAPLHHAAIKGNADCLKVLLEAGADKGQGDI